MNVSEDQRAVGRLSITLTGPGGGEKLHLDLDNLIVNTGRNFLAAALVGPVTFFNNIAIGTGTTAPTSTDTALQTEAARVVMSSESSVNNVATMVAIFAPGVGTAAVTEAGIFNAAVAGIMMSHVVFPVINKAAADTLTITWTITVN